MTRRPTTRTSARNRATLPRVRASVASRLSPPIWPARPRAVPAQEAGQRRQQDQGQDHGQVLDDQPADGDAAGAGIQGASLLERAEQDHRAGDREGEAEDEAGAERPAPEEGDRDAEDRRHRDLAQGAGDGDLADRHQVLDREVQADAEHQQDDADLGQLARQLLVADEAGRERPDRDAGQQIADQRRQAQLDRQETAGERHDQAHDDGGDQLGFMGQSAHSHWMD